MIEVLATSRCTGCNICVHACPTNVFEPVPGSAPRIARQQDCQTCFMCELYCPEDALFVAPQADSPVSVEIGKLEHLGLLGSYRAAIGWGRQRQSTAAEDTSYQLMIRAHEEPVRRT